MKRNEELTVIYWDPKAQEEVIYHSFDFRSRNEMTKRYRHEMKFKVIRVMKKEEFDEIKNRKNITDKEKLRIIEKNFKRVFEIVDRST